MGDHGWAERTAPRDVPKHNRVVGPGGSQNLAIGTEGNRGHTCRMAVKRRTQRLPRSNVPENDRLVSGGRGEETTRRIEGECVHKLFVPFETANDLPGLKVPQEHSSARTGVV